MKIFNWVHRKFHHIGTKDEEFGRDDVSKKEVSQEMAQTLLVDGSILSIGTFGIPFHDQPNPYEPEPEQGEHEGSDSDDDDNESEANPLVLTTFKHSLDNMTSSDAICSSEITDYSSDSSDYKKLIGERTTLADLFLADSEVKLNLNPVEKLVLNKTETQQQEADWVATKSPLSFAKKLTPQVGDKPRPVNKLNQLMRRMMRRKIHPELGQRKAPADHDKNVEAHELESAYLLPTPVVAAEVVG